MRNGFASVLLSPCLLAIALGGCDDGSAASYVFTASTTSGSWGSGGGADGLLHGGAEHEDIGYSPLVPLTVPVSGNVTVDNHTVTAVVRQCAPSGGSDGQFAAFDQPSARADAERFLAGALAGAMPRVGP